MSLYHKLGRTLLKLRNKLKAIKCIFNFKAERRNKKTSNKIKVGFVCQYVPSWGKMEPIYRIMKNSDKFDTFLLCLPMGIHNYKLDDTKDLSNDAYDYFLNYGYEAVNALVGQNKWLNLKKLKLDYLFYTRPYNHYMPKNFTSHRVNRYTKVCMLPYAYNLLEDNYRSTLDKEFFCGVYYYFAECKHAMEINKRQFIYAHNKGLQKTECYGMPGLEDLVRAKSKETEAWSFSSNDFKVMWTPRWTTNKWEGGSNFFMYKDSLLEYAKDNPDVDFLFRPHPLMFDNFIKTKEMTREEVSNYTKRVEELDNISFDKQKEYGASFWESSVLLSDISSMMYEYFLTGKPIIYCASNVDIEFSENAKDFIKGCYISYTQEETFKILDQLKGGEDPLKETREKLVEELFGDNIEEIPKQIVQAIVDDYSKRLECR